MFTNSYISNKYKHLLKNAYICFNTLIKIWIKFKINP